MQAEGKADSELGVPLVPGESTAVLGARVMRGIQQRLARAMTIEELFAKASVEAARVCGFDRAVVLSVEHGTLTANATGAIADPASDMLRRQVLSRPVTLPQSSDESELIRVPERAGASRRTAPSALKSALQLGHHLVVPVAPEGRSIALLLLDRAAADVGDADRERAEIVVQILELVLERLVLRQRLRQLEDDLRHLTASAQVLVREAVHAPVELSGEAGHGLIVSLFPSGESTGRAADSAVGGLTERERQIAAFLVVGRSNREIAAELHLSPETVKGYVAKLLRKLGAANRVEAVAQLARWSDPAGAD